jgi:hypothetical protein
MEMSAAYKGWGVSVEGSASHDKSKEEKELNNKYTISAQFKGLLNDG